MKKIVTSLAALLLLVGVTAFASDMKVGVIDLPQILQHSPQVAAINKKLRAQFAPEQQKIIAAQNKIRSEARKLSPKDSQLTATQKKAIQEKIVADQKELQQMVIKFQTSVSSAQTQAMKSFMGSVNSTVKEIAKEQNLDIVLLKPAVIYADNTVDITSQVLSKLK